MNERCGRENEGPQTNGKGSVQCCSDGRATQPKMVVPDMSRERGAAD